MITRPTVLVLGAGASSHCHYPLGRELVARIAKLRNVKTDDELLSALPPERLTAFIERLSYSDPASVDVFLEANRDEQAIGKYLIARELKRYEHIDALFPPNEAGWYRQLFERMLVNGEPRFEENALSIVTFNYDRSFEAYLHRRVKTTYRLTDEEALQVVSRVPIVHVHGILGDLSMYPYTVDTTAPQLRAISEGIQVIHELEDKTDDFCNEAFRQAHGYLGAAERIHFLGFGFHPDNVRRFRFFSPEALQGKEVLATVMMGTVATRGLASRLAPLGFPETTYQPARCDQYFDFVADLE